MTPQRTLHGKRHIRARRTVVIGRDKKRIKRFEAGLIRLSRAIGKIKPDAWIATLDMAARNLTAALLNAGAIAGSAFFTAQQNHHTKE